MAQGFETKKDQQPTKVASNLSTYTQSDLATLLATSVTTVKSYLKKVQDIYVWLPKDAFTDASGRYTEDTLQKLVAYQNACGVAKVVDGKRVENDGRITFKQFQAEIWALENFNPDAPETVEAEIFQPENLKFQDFSGNFSPEPYIPELENFQSDNWDGQRYECQETAIAAREDMSDALAMFRSQAQSMGKAIGQQIASEMTAQLAKEVRNGVMGELNNLTRTMQGG